MATSVREMMAMKRKKQHEGFTKINLFISLISLYKITVLYYVHQTLTITTYTKQLSGRNKHKQVIDCCLVTSYNNGSLGSQYSVLMFLATQFNNSNC